MSIECLTCGKQSDNRKGFFEMSASVGNRYICKECAAEVGIKNFMAAGFQSNTGVLKKYVKIHPEAQWRLDQQLGLKAKRKQELNAELVKGFDDATKHIGLTEKKEDKYTCSACGNVWYTNEYDVAKNLVDIQSTLTIGKSRILSQCPKCGSNASTKKVVKYWVDKKGNCVDREE